MSGFQGDVKILWTDGNGGDIVKNNGDYRRNIDFENMIIILLGTKSKTWNNLLRREDKLKIEGLDIEFGDSITLSYLRRVESKAEKCLSPFIDLEIAEDVTVEASNPEADTLILNVTITEKYGRTSKYTLLWDNFFNRDSQ